MAKWWQARSGWSLVEVLAASTILALVVASIVEFAGAITLAGRHNRYETEAALVSETLATRIAQCKTFDNLQAFVQTVNQHPLSVLRIADNPFIDNHVDISINLPAENPISSGATSLAATIEDLSGVTLTDSNVPPTDHKLSTYQDVLLQDSAGHRAVYQVIITLYWKEG